MTNHHSGLLSSLFRFYPDTVILTNPNTAHMVVDGHRLVSQQSVPGLSIKTKETDEAIEIELHIASGIKVENPIHTCVGLMNPHGKQLIRILVKLESGSSAKIIAHCLFPNAELAKHVMHAHIELDEGAELHHTEEHFHGPFGGIEVIPEAEVLVGPHARYISDFSLTTGRVGKLNINYKVETADYAVAEISARVFGHVNDEIKIKDELILSGKKSRGLIKTRVALENEARSEVIGITHGNAEGARGHMDCMELIRDHAVASAEPIVKVSHPLAKVTHEAAVGTVDQKQLETLMARGLTPEQAVDVVITGMLR